MMLDNDVFSHVPFCWGHLEWCDFPSTTNNRIVLFLKVEGRRQPKLSTGSKGSKSKKDSTSSMKGVDEGGGEGGGGPSVSERANELFRSLDTDNDGEITQDEFVNGYLQMHQMVRQKNFIKLI